MYLLAIRPICLIDDNDDNPYWDDSIDKYFARPLDPLFQQITYATKDYHA